MDKTSTFIDLVRYLGQFLIGINTLLFFKSFRFKSTAFKTLTFYLLLTFIIQFYSHYLATKRIHNLFLTHYFFIGQFLLLSFFFLKIIDFKIIKKIIFAGILLIPLLLIWNALSSDPYMDTFNIPEILLTTIPLIIYSFSFLVQKIDSENKRYIYFNASFFIYTSCSILLFAGENITSEIQRILSSFNAILYVFYQFFIFLEWYKNFRKKPTKEKMIQN
jgi:hypothetical protein